MLALYTGYSLDARDERVFESIGQTPESLLSPLLMMAWILVLTGVIMLFIKWKKFGFIKALEVVALFSAAFIVVESFIPELWSAAFVFIGALMAWKYWHPEDVLVKNAFSALAAAGVGAVLGVSLGLLPILFFLGVLSVYDYVAVFKTKHMVSMATSLKQKGFSMTADIPTPFHTFQLGTGDLAMPSAVVVSIAVFLGSVPAGFAAIGGLAGLLWTVDYVGKNVGKALPAIPPITIGILLALALYKSVTALSTGSL